MIMPNTSQLLMLLVNIYFNLTMVNPYLDKVDLFNVTSINSEVLGFHKQASPSPEAKIDQLMQDYVDSLKQLNRTTDETKALALIESTRKLFIQRATILAPELKSWLSSLTTQQKAVYKERRMLKPYFKTINDLTLSYNLSHNLEHNPSYKRTFETMSEFMNLLYN